MKVVLCLIVVTFLCVISTIHVDAACSPSIRVGSSPSQAKFSSNPNQNINKNRRIFASPGVRPGGRSRTTTTTTRRPPICPLGPRFCGIFNRAKRQTGPPRESFAESLKTKVQRKTARSFASPGFPSETIGSCCPQTDGYLVGWGSCWLWWPISIPTVQCPGQSCYNGYWWQNNEGWCQAQNPRNQDVVLYCPWWPWFFIQTVTTYCNCGCSSC